MPGVSSSASIARYSTGVARMTPFPHLCDMAAIPRDLRAALLQDLTRRSYVESQGGDRTSSLTAAGLQVISTPPPVETSDNPSPHDRASRVRTPGSGTRTDLRPSPIAYTPCRRMPHQCPPSRLCADRDPRDRDAQSAAPVAVIAAQAKRTRRALPSPDRRVAVRAPRNERSWLMVASNRATMSAEQPSGWCSCIQRYVSISSGVKGSSCTNPPFLP